MPTLLSLDLFLTFFPQVSCNEHVFQENKVSYNEYVFQEKKQTFDFKRVQNAGREGHEVNDKWM